MFFETRRRSHESTIFRQQVVKVQGAHLPVGDFRIEHRTDGSPHDRRLNFGGRVQSDHNRTVIEAVEEHRGGVSESGGHDDHILHAIQTRHHRLDL